MKEKKHCSAITGVSQTRTCVEIKNTCCLALHGDRHIVPFYVGSTDASVRQLNLKETTAALHVMEGHIVETGLDVRLIGIERLMENVLHDLGQKRKRNRQSLSMTEGVYTHM